MQAILVKQHVAAIEALQLTTEVVAMPAVSAGECLVQVKAVGVNPSDALATLGYFKEALLPRIPGRDFSGVVVDGPQAWLGKAVWGSGGCAGISQQGTLAEYIRLSPSQLALAPDNLDLLSAGAQTLPYLTAYLALFERATLQPGETVLIVGALGQVGRAAMSLARWKHCQPIALVCGQQQLQAAKQQGWVAVDSQASDVIAQVLAVNQGTPISVILNSIGNTLWSAFTTLLAKHGRLVTIAAREAQRDVTVNLFDLYRKNQSILGLNTVEYDFAENARRLDEIRHGFETQQLQPLAVERSHVHPLHAAEKAFRRVMEGANSRVVIEVNDK